MIDLKPDAIDICSHIDSLQDADWLSSSQKWWPKYLYHFTNIDNAIKILSKGQFISRNKAEEAGEMFTDNASPGIIAQTSDRWKDYVRLYFRPRTPTQYSNEGYRPVSFRKYGSHCPVPIVFTLDSKAVLSLKGTMFSSGSLASSEVNVSNDAIGFRELPFNLIYHDSYFVPDEKKKIVHHRQAEVIIPNSLSLKYVKHIWCRSHAEYQTFLNLLSPNLRQQWRKKVGFSQKGHFFYQQWAFIEYVNLSREGITIKFNELFDKKIFPYELR